MTSRPAITKKNIYTSSAIAGIASIVVQTALAKGVQHDINVGADQAPVAIRQLAEQTGIQVLFRPQLVEGFTTVGVAGHMTGIDALTHMLGGSGLVVSEINESTVTIVAPEGGGSAGASDAAQSANDASSSRANPKSAVPEIFIEGSRSLNAEIKRDEDDVQPYVIFDSKEITRSGASDVRTFLREKLTAASPAANNAAQVATSVTGGSTAFDLRGLGTDETLILINGRRAVSNSLLGSAGQADLNGIPLAAIERIEVLPSTASGIFGGGATGGAINVVLKQDYSGVQLSSLFENTFNATAPSRTINLSGGFSPDGGKTSILAFGSYSEANQLYVKDRDFLQSSRELVLANNPSALLNSTVPPLGATTNIRSTTATLQLKPKYGGATLPSNITYVPYGYSGVSSDNGAALVANAGHFNLDLADTAQASGGGNQSLLNGPTVKSFGMTVHRRLSKRFEAFTELWFSQNISAATINNSATNYTLSPNDAANPFLQTIRLSTPGLGLDGPISSEVANRRAILGGAMSLGETWHVEAEYAWSRSRFSNTSTNLVAAPGAADVASGKIDVFRDVNSFGNDFSAFLPANTRLAPTTATLQNPSVRAGGSIPISLPGGEPSLAALVEYRHEALSDAYSISPPSTVNLYPARHQSTRSAYLEARVPLFSQRNSISGVQLLELQLAGRHDRYETITANPISVANPAPIVQRRQASSSTDPTLGIRYSPGGGVTFRSSYATGFLPPNMTQLVPLQPTTSPFTPLNGITDPKRGNEFVVGNVQTRSGGNTELTPESAKSWTLGVVIEPSYVPGLRISVDGMKIKKFGNIVSLPLQRMVDSEDYVSGRISRAAPTPQNDPQNYGVGPINGIDASLVNLARTDINALDIAFSYRLTTSRWGEGMLSLRGTRTSHFRDQVAPAAPSTESVGLISNLKWIGNASLTWNLRNWSAGWQTQYYDMYWLNTAHSVVQNQGSATIPSQIYHDFFVSYGRGNTPLSGVTEKLLTNTSVQIGIRNVLNKEPPIVASGSYSTLGDPRLARYYLNFQKNF